LSKARRILSLDESLSDSDLAINLRSERSSLRSCVLRVESLLFAQQYLENSNHWQETVRWRSKIQKQMVGLSGIVARICEPAWRLSNKQPTDEGIDLMIRNDGELFLASRVVDFLRQVMPQLYSLVGFTMVAVVAMMLAMSVYPFPAHNTLLWISWLVLLVTIFVVFWVFTSINRNRIISMLSGTTPNAFSWDRAFTGQLFLYGIVPVLVLIGGQLPNGVGGILSWIAGLFSVAK
jgi:hypothetical protein